MSTQGAVEKFDVCVVGSGPGGYVAAIRAAQLGKKTAIVERQALGGVCLNVGCIPSKAMISAAHFYHRMLHDGPAMGFAVPQAVKMDARKLQQWKQSVCDKMSGGVAQLLKGNSISVFMGEAVFLDAKRIRVSGTEGPAKVIEGTDLILAMGSRPIEIPGFKVDEKNVLSSTGALALSDDVKRMVVIGGGYIGLEIGSYMAQFGTKVTVVEAGPALLQGVADPDCVNVVARRLKKNGVEVLLNAKARGYKVSKGGLSVSVEVGGKEQMIDGDKVLLTVGRRPNTDLNDLKQTGVALDEKGFVVVNAQRRTNVPGVYAIGDIAGQPMLAHKASHEGVLVAEVIAGHNRAFDAKAIPAVIFVDPEIASAGLMESECVAKGYKDLTIGRFPFAANGRAVSMMETDGLVKIIADAKTHVVLGIHICGPEASNMISEAVLAIEMGARLEDLALTIHPHPTLGETMMEAAEAALGQAIHILQKPLAANGATRASSGKTSNGHRPNP